jgi:hypothetical protein
LHGPQVVPASSDGGQWWLSTVVRLVTKEEDGGWHQGIFGAAACGEQGPAPRGGAAHGGGSWVHEGGGLRWSSSTVAAHGREESRGDRDGDGVCEMWNENIYPQRRLDKDEASGSQGTLLAAIFFL